MLHIFNIFHENKDSDNCAKVLEEECIKMSRTKSQNYEQDCNVVSMNSLNIHDANDMQSHKLGEAMFDEDDIFCGVHWVCKYTQNREDLFCKRHKYLETEWLQERLDVCAENLNFLSHPCEL